MTILLLFFVWSASQSATSQVIQAFEEDPPPSSVIDGVTFRSGNWEPMLPAKEAGQSWGNHRAVLEINPGAQWVQVSIPWRRHDKDPDQKGYVLVNAATGDVVKNVVALHVDNEKGEFVFEPVGQGETYHLYYFPYETTGGYYPKLHYPPPTETAFPDWLNALNGFSEETRSQWSRGEVVAIESINDFHSFFPMELAATRDEVNQFMQAHPRPFYLFPEYRTRSIRMRYQLPWYWTTQGVKDTFRMVAQRGEYYAFQLGVFASSGRLENVQPEVSALVSGSGETLGAEAITCLNTEGIDLFGKPFTKKVDVEVGEVQALWFGMDIPENLAPGVYEGTVTVKAEGQEAQTVRLLLRITEEQRADRGDDNPALMSRLRWLNSTLGTDPDFIIEPFIPVKGADKTLHILGREVVLGEGGLPDQIRSYFNPEMVALSETAEEVLARPMGLEVRVGEGLEDFSFQPYQIVQKSQGQAAWMAKGVSEHFDLDVSGVLEYEGMLDYQLRLVARQDLAVENISLPVTYEPGAAKYMLGLGYKGQQRPETIDWKWDVTRHQEGVWLGGIHKGIQYVLRDENYVRPLNTNFYQSQPLNLPPSWYNEGKGGIRIEKDAFGVRADNYSGGRQMTAGDTLHFNIRLLLTPFKLIDTEAHFNTRFVHRYVPVDTVLAWGGTVVNVHHANEINPYINYPFFNLDQQTDYIQEAHAKGVKVKLYNTIRELTYKSHELFALRSLGDEIINDGEGGGHSWMQEHMQDHYHRAWHAHQVDDAAFLNKGTSRWTNYYIEGLNWLAQNQHIDGLYLDDIAFSRETVKRMVAVLQNHRDEIIIDLHSANQFNPKDGFINSAFLYMEHFPFISRLWFGEYFEYDKDPDYWLTEVSGLPFGLMGEMLEKGGHPYRGLLYGMSTRFWKDTDPRPVWQLLTEFGAPESRMKGYWLDNTPVKTGHDAILATTYIKSDQALIVLASWSDRDEAVSLQIDWAALGIDDPAQVKLFTPEVKGLQSYQAWNPEEPIGVPKNMGLFLLVDISQIDR